MRNITFLRSKSASLFLIFLTLFLFQTKVCLSEIPENYNRIFAYSDCSISNQNLEIILNEVKKNNKDAINSLVDCLKMDRKLIFNASIIDASQFQYASEILRQDKNFINRIIKVSPDVLNFIPEKLKLDKEFIKNATYLNRDALKYADLKLLNNKIFMKEMIILDSRNYIYASERIKNMPEIAEIAFKDDGTLLEYATDNIKNSKSLVTIAVKSDSSSIKYANEILQKDRKFKKISNNKTSIKSQESLKKFLQNDYIDNYQEKNVGLVLRNRMKFFGDSDNKIVDRNYITKWQKFIKYDDKNNLVEETRLVSDDSHNYPNSWKEDFKKYPQLIEKVENFFRKRQVDQSTIENLSTTYFWKVKTKPLTLVFNLYLLRDSKDDDLGSKFSNITSLTAIAQKHGNNWKMTVIEVIFDSEVKVDVSFEEGHKKFYLWDLYKVNEKDRNPKIIFKTEEPFKNFFEVFEEQNNGKYKMIYRVNPLE
ncbi:MAG: DUF4116 domain-containing protein [Pelagibacterales bacterium]|nr:DUF4116 domain-containing protein [Pelagibacterales bacterium]